VPKLLLAQVGVAVLPFAPCEALGGGVPLPPAVGTFEPLGAFVALVGLNVVGPSVDSVGLAVGDLDLDLAA